MTQSELSDSIDIFLGNDGRPSPCCVGTGRAQPDQIGAQAIDPGGKTALGDLRQCVEPNEVMKIVGSVATLDELLILLKKED